VVTVTDPIAIFKQPLWFYMAWHSTLACYLSVAFAVAGWYAYLALKGRTTAYVRSGLVAAMLLGGVCAFLQPMSGDLLAKFVFKTQPVKFAAMEGQFKTEKNAPMRIGGWPDEKTRETKYAIEVPGGLSFIATGDSTAEVPGLDRVPESDWPNVELTHLAFQIMVGAGSVLMIVSVWFWIAWLRYRENILNSRWLMRALCVCAPLGFIGLEAGWMVTEVGRQPWVIQGLMRTKDAVTPVAGVQGMLVAFTLLYGLLTVTVIVLLRQLARSSKEVEPAAK
jgi:cytochrome d ubiquinol oxidase subunit I